MFCARLRGTRRVGLIAGENKVMPTRTLRIRGLAHLTAVASAVMLASAGIAKAGLINPTPANGGITVNMTENGGPVMTGHVDTFAIFYGDFTGANTGQPVTAQQVTGQWLNDMNGTDYLNIASTYTGAPNGTVSTNVTFSGAVNVSSSFLGTSLTDANILTLAQDARNGTLPGGNLPVLGVTNAIYFVFTAPGIAEQQDATACGWHNGNMGTNTIYSWVGPALGCDFLGGNVSGNPVANEFTETGSHELFESLTDPFPNSAYNDNTPGHGEVGDVCTDSNFNGNLNGNHYDLQAIWTLNPAGSPTGGACSEGVTRAVAVPEPPSPAIFAAALVGLGLIRRRRREALV